MSSTQLGRFRMAFLIVTLSFIGSACSKELDPTTTTGPMGVAAGGGPTTDMTEEGCILHPDICHPDDGGGDEDPPPNPQVGMVEEYGPVDYSIRSAPGIIDPHPGAPGVYLGFSDSSCYTRVQRYPQQDSDHDGLTDFCEYQLARAFAPMLNNSEGAECFAGEPYWAAKYFDNTEPIHTGDFVRIAYMPGYYQDCGTWQFYYGAHSGDSELIQLTVGYYDVTQHWEVFNGFLSAHTCTDDSLCESQFSGAPSQTFPDRDAFQYPGGRLYTYPRVYVSHHKHANYNTKSNCDNGGAMWGFYEYCTNHDRGRFKVWESHNVGNVRYPLVDCTPSQRSGADPNVEECFWSNQNFDGWNAGQWGQRPPGYIKLLHSYAYACKWLGPGTSWCSRYGL
jgi:hypothetical protein